MDADGSEAAFLEDLIGGPRAASPQPVEAADRWDELTRCITQRRELADVVRRRLRRCVDGAAGGLREARTADELRAERKPKVQRGFNVRPCDPFRRRFLDGC